MAIVLSNGTRLRKRKRRARDAQHFRLCGISFCCRSFGESLDDHSKQPSKLEESWASFDEKMCEASQHDLTRIQNDVDAPGLSNMENFHRQL